VRGSQPRRLRTSPGRGSVSASQNRHHAKQGVDIGATACVKRWDGRGCCLGGSGRVRVCEKWCLFVSYSTAARPDACIPQPTPHQPRQQPTTNSVTLSPTATSPSDPVVLHSLRPQPRDRRAHHVSTQGRKGASRAKGRKGATAQGRALVAAVAVRRVVLGWVDGFVCVCRG
jgi:hypothetical protein